MKKSRPSRAAFRRVLLGIEQLEDRRLLSCDLNLSSTFNPGGTHSGGTITTKLDSIDQAILLNGDCVVNADSLGGLTSIVFRGDIDPNPRVGHELEARVVKGGVTLGKGTIAPANGNFTIAVLTNQLPSQASTHDLSISIVRTNVPVPDTNPKEFTTLTIPGMTPYSLKVDTVRPTASSILRQNPISELTNQSQVVFRVTFSEPVEQVSTADFALNGTAGGNIASVAQVSTSIYDVTVNGLGSSNGTLNLDFAPGQNIRDLLANGLTNTTAGTEQQYLLDTTPPIVGLPRLDVSDDSGAADGITNQRSGLTFRSSSATASSVEFELQRLNGGIFTTVETIQGRLVDGTFVTDFPSALSFEDGTYQVRAKATKLSGSFAFSSFSPLVIDSTIPIAPTRLRTATGVTTLKATPSLLFDATEQGAAIELFRNGILVGSRIIPANATQALTTIDPPASGDGVFQYQIRQIDRAENIGPLSNPLILAIDSKPPTIDTAAATKFRVAQSELSEPSSQLPVFVTTSRQPEMLARISDQAFSDRNNLIKIELLVDGVATAIENANFTITPNTKGFTSVSIKPSSPLAIKKVLSLQLRITDQAGNVTTTSSGGLRIFVNQVGAATQNAPGTPILNEKWFIGANFTSPAAKDSFTVEVDQAIPAATIVSINGTGASDASKRYEVTNSVKNVTTGKTVLTLKTALTESVSFDTPLMWLRPWTTTFDKTTQTTWLTMEDGVSVAQFDPTNGNIKLYNIGIRNPITGVARYGDPHGVAFDFNSHLTPRVWFVYRNENLDTDLPDFGDTTKPFDTTAHGPGTVGYLDIVSNTLWTFDIQESLFASASNPTPDLGLTGTHATFVDSRGHVWLTSDRSIIEIDTSRFPDGKPTGNLSSTAGTIIVHNLPKGLGDTGTTDVPFQPHGIQVIVDNRTGTPYVFAADGDAKNGTARVILLQPGANGNSDQWKEWNFDTLLKDEALAKPEDPVPGSATLFLALDDNETPGKPEDDRLIAASPGALAKGAKGIMRVLDLSTILGPLVQSDLERLSGKPLPSIAVPTEAQVTTYRLPGTPGSSQSFASNQVPLVDRAGNVFFVDAIGGVGRFNANEPNPDFLLSKTPVKLTDFPPSQANKGALSFSSTKVEPVKFTAKAIGASTTKLDRSNKTGLDQYDVAIVSTATHGGASAGGLFRGALSAENSLYGANSSSDSISTALFAESNRRQLAVVASPFELPKGARIGGRAVLQVLRDGSVVLTARGDGELRDEQVNLTKALLNAGKIASFDHAAVVGDMAALESVDGVIEALGRQADGRLIRYTFNPPTKSWKTEDLKNPLFWSANIKLTIPNGRVAAEDPMPAPGIGFTITTTDGHLIVVPSGGDPVDLSPSAPLPADYAVYAGVGAVVAGTRFRFYGGNQTGSIVEYSTDRRLGDIQRQTLVVPRTASVRPAGDSDRDIRILRNIQPLVDGATIHLFATDGVARLVHYQLDSNGNVMLAENVTQLVQNTGQVFGYFDFQKAYGGRVYTYVSATKDNDGNIRVYGTNGGDLIEFTLDTAGKWRVGNLTNDIKSTDGVKNDSRIPANFVFGAPSVYRDTTGERHVLQINAEGEIVEYYTLANDPQKRFHTQNVNLRIGDASKIENLRFRSSSVESTASVQSIPIISSSVSSGSTASLFAAPYLTSRDVNADGELSPLDVLLIINYLNTPAETSKQGDGESFGNRLDVNGDGWISPLDVLILVNHLNGEKAGEGEGEGEGLDEACPTDAESITATALDLAFADLGNWDSFQTNAKKRHSMQRGSR